MEGELAITFHRTPRVQDNSVPSRQEIYELGAKSPVSHPLLLAEIKGDESEKYALCLEC